MSGFNTPFENDSPLENGYLLDRVSCAYRIGERMHPVFSGLSLNIPLDRITVVLGKSGCGKTTLLRLLAGLLHPASGGIHFVKNGASVAPRVGMVFQESRLFPWLSVRDNITIHRKKDRETQAIQQKYLSMMGLEEFASAYPSQLSGGMSQRIAIARAIAYEPDILLMDEPFSALDYFTRLQMQDEILKIFHTLGIGIVFVTHNVEEALKLASDLLVLKNQAAPVRFELPSRPDSTDKENEAVLVKRRILELLKES